MSFVIFLVIVFGYFLLPHIQSLGNTDHYLVTVTSITLILIISHLNSAVRSLLSEFPAFRLQPICLFNQSIVTLQSVIFLKQQPFVYINTYLKILSNAHFFLQNKTYTLLFNILHQLPSILSANWSSTSPNATQIMTR